MQSCSKIVPVPIVVAPQNCANSNSVVIGPCFGKVCTDPRPKGYGRRSEDLPTCPKNPAPATQTSNTTIGPLKETRLNLSGRIGCLTPQRLGATGCGAPPCTFTVSLLLPSRKQKSAVEQSLLAKLQAQMVFLPMLCVTRLR